MIDSVVLKNSVQYFMRTIPNFKKEKLKGVWTFTCPVCFKDPVTCRFMSGQKLHCLNTGCTCRGKDILTLISEKEKITREEASRLIITTLNLKEELTYDVEALLKFYSEVNFDLVPITRHSKAPIEKDWLNQIHKDIEEWKKWINDMMLNIGVKTGAKSNITVVDFDGGEVPQEMTKMMGETLTQKTRQGYHYFYEYEEDLVTGRMNDLKIDILNNGKQCILYPSLIDNYRREFISPLKINKMSPDLKKFIKERMGKNPLTKTYSEITKENIDTENFNLEVIPEGSRNSFMIQLGGILRKELNLQQTVYTLDIINKHFCKPSLSAREFRAILDQTSKYASNDLNTLSSKILKYLKIVEEATGRDIQEVVGEKKEEIDKVLSFLIKEGYIVRKRRMYYIIKKAEWLDTFPKLDNEVTFKMPYFHDIAHFNYGDMVLLAGQSKTGKTTISMNIVKDFINQGIKPYYICLETGARFLKTAQILEMKEGDFFWSFVADPTKIELEPNAVTIIDWLLIEDKATTDLVMKYFVEQLFKTQGFLIIFMQLKKNDEWFAPNMVDQFPSLAARYIYDDDPTNYGVKGAWNIDAIRESKVQRKTGNIPCVYDWKERTLKRIEKNEETS